MKRSSWVVLALTLVLGLPMQAGAAAAQPAVPDLVAGNTAFAFDLYGALRQDADGNLVVSPYSISQALAMTYAGARGETAAQIARVCSFDPEASALTETFGALNTDLVARGNAEANATTNATERRLRIANALWGEQTYPFSADFSAQLEAAYGAGFRQTDFLNDPEAARLAVNDWVAEQTNGRIQDIIPPGALDSSTLLVLANAISFVSQWYLPFDADATETGAFHLLDGSAVDARFMYRHDHFNYGRGDGYQVVELDYGEGASQSSDFAFTIILPDDGHFAEIEQSLDAGALDSALTALDYSEIHLYLPKFTFSFDAELSAALSNMGMTDAFDPARADFSGMVERTPPTPLFLGAVLHKAFIAVDEQGTEAAAATVEMFAGAAPPMEAPPVVRMDRPFFFLIRDTVTGSVLFLGRVMTPSQS